LPHCADTLSHVIFQENFQKERGFLQTNTENNKKRQYRPDFSE